MVRFDGEPGSIVLSWDSPRCLFLQQISLSLATLTSSYQKDKLDTANHSPRCYRGAGASGADDSLGDLSGMIEV